MAIEFHCPHCNKLLRTGDERAGLTAKCPDCGASIAVPGPKAGGSTGFDLPPADFDSPSGTKPCPMCGEQIKSAAIRCRYCGEDIGGPRRSGARTSHLVPHRGGLILAFGLLSWLVCPVFAPVAWVMGNTDLAEMEAGRMDPSGEGSTNAGKIIGMIQCILFLVGIGIVGMIFCAGGAAVL